MSCSGWFDMELPSCEVMNLRDANLQVYKKTSFTHPSSWILPSFSQNESRLLLPKRL